MLALVVGIVHLSGISGRLVRLFQMAEENKKLICFSFSLSLFYLLYILNAFPI